MFLIDPITALVTVIIAVFLYKYVDYRKPDVNWGSSTQAQIHNSALHSTLELLSVEEHVKNYRPEILLLSGNPSVRPVLVDFANLITKGTAFLTCSDITTETLDYKRRSHIVERAYKWFKTHKIKSFYSLLKARNLEEGAQTYLEIVGLGKLRPNILMMGYKSNWRECDGDELKGYFHTLHEALNMHYGLTILRVQGGFDVSHIVQDEIFSHEETEKKDDDKSHIKVEEKHDSTHRVSTVSNKSDIPEMENGVKKHSKKPKDLYIGIDGQELPKDLLNEITMFRGKQKGTIDVWWLYDDGGLTVLLPYILSHRSQWSNCKLRLFALANKKDDLEIEQRSMVNLLHKFRIDFSDLIIIPDVTKKANDLVKLDFNNIIKKFKVDENDMNEKYDDLMLTDQELMRNREKTNRNLRIRELLVENSKEASLIVMTLPIPKKHSVNASLYMAWLEILSKDMPPFLFIRGNQTSVLTFYS